MKEFNTTAVCVPEKHYMVDLTDRVNEIRKIVDAGKYFVINRARQYGKTTTLYALKNAIKEDYDVVSLDFQELGNASFETEETFCRGFIRLILEEHDFDQLRLPPATESLFKEFVDEKNTDNKIVDLLRAFRSWCKDAEKPLVLLIDEVDTATNNQVFLDFLAGLRSGYINRDTKGIKTFQSVILAGVTDIRYLKYKIRDEAQSKQKSLWNIAADFSVDMSLSETGIKNMLDEYEADHHAGMDTSVMAGLLRDYTNGYPFLVSRLCQLTDTQVVKSKGLKDAWSKNGFLEAVKLLLVENNTLFRSLTKNLNNNPKLTGMIRSLLMEGTRITYNGQQDELIQLKMYGVIDEDHGTVRIDNRIFETVLYNLFLSDEELKNSAIYKEGELARNQFVKDGRLDMRLILDRFIKSYTQIFGPLTDKFKEKDGRELFLLYLKPIINGTGNYYIEAQTRDQTRTDVIVDYLGQQYIIELKIWRGERYNADGEKQISEYLEYFNLDTGYMLSFNFNKNKETGCKRVECGEKVLFEYTL